MTFNLSLSRPLSISSNIAGMVSGGVRSADFVAAPNSTYEITGSCKMTLPSNPNTNDRVAFILTSNAIFDITTINKINGKVLATDVVKRTQTTYLWFIWIYSGPTNGWIWNSAYNSSISEVYIGTGDTNVVLFLKFDEAVPVDSSVLPKTLNVVGTSQNTSDKKTGTSSRWFGSSNSYINVNHPDLAFGTSNFTVEAWVKYSSVDVNSGWFLFNTLALSGSSNSQGTLNLARNGDRLNGQGTGSSYISVNSLSSYAPINTWHHFALTRAGSTLTIWINGIARATATNPLNYTSTFLCVGAYYSSSYCWNGLIDSFRVTKGVSRYTTNFNPNTDTGLT